MAVVRYQRALAQALRDEMLADESVIVIGEDVRHSLRGVTKGLASEFGDRRVLDAPISEQAFTSFALGASTQGMRPVIEYQIPSLTFVAFEQIVNQAQRMHLMTGGQISVPITCFIPGSGARGGLAGQHSDNPYTWFAHAGVKTVVPGSASDAYHLFRAAIRDPDPVVLCAPAAALGVKGEIAPQEPGIGEAVVAREGSQLSIITLGHLVPYALDVADELADDLSIEVVDLRSAFPVDRQTIIASAQKTRRVVVVDDANRSIGLAAEVLASLAGVRLDAPAIRVTRADATIPFAPVLEAQLIPTKEKIRAAISRAKEERYV